MSVPREVFERWKSTLRYKASRYEHPARLGGEEVAYPSLDDVCNEMDAFLAGLEVGDHA